MTLPPRQTSWTIPCRDATDRAMAVGLDDAPAVAEVDLMLPEASPVGTPHLVAVETREVTAGSGLYVAGCGETCELPACGEPPVTTALAAVVVGDACPRCDRYRHTPLRMWMS